MEPQKVKTSGKDFFLHLGAMIALYWSVGALLNLLYSIINSAFPRVDAYYSYYPSISFPVASLIVIYPVFVLLSSLNQKSYVIDPSKKEIWVRRWMEYITLFISGAILVGSLVSVIYLFLDGQELTTAFLLKTLSWFVIAGMVFGYHIQDIREKINNQQRKAWLIVSTIIVLVSIVLGFAITGSPRTQRLMRYDDQKVADLQNIQNQIITYWQSKNKLPESLSDITDPLSYEILPLDPQTGASYTYNKKGELSFELCADFNKASVAGNEPRISNAMKYGIDNEKWSHAEGYQCFERTVDPDRYPPFNKKI